jgi:hypothetical protein
MLGSLYYARQARTLLKMARVTNDPRLLASLISKASDLKERIDDAPLAPDVEPDLHERRQSG